MFQYPCNQQEAIIIKKYLFLILAGLLVLTGCGGSKKSAETPPPTEVTTTAEPSTAPEPSPEPSAASCPYSDLTFDGCDVNVQHYPRSYSTTDTELISEIWDILNSPERSEVSDYTRYESNLLLIFKGQDTPKRVFIQSNDYGTFRDDEDFVNEGTTYALAPGSYSAISTLLTEYTTENYSFTIDEDFLSIDTNSAEQLQFQRGSETSIRVLPSDTGDFTEDWGLIPTDIMNWEHAGRYDIIRNIYTKEGVGPVEITVYFDELLIGVSCDGLSELYSTDQSTLDSIDRLFDSVYS